MLKIIITKGLPASGKTTFSLNHIKTNPNWKRVNKDELRAMVDGGNWSRKKEEFIIKIRNNLILLYLQNGFNVIVDDTNFGKHEHQIKSFIGANFKDEINYEIKEFKCDIEECIRRDLKRPNPVGEKVIREMYMKYINHKANPPLNNPKLSTIVLCDIDGTLALMGDKRNPYDWNKVDQDDVNEPVANLVRLLNSCESKYEVILFSGRDEICRGKTESWLSLNGIPYKELHMRQHGDIRKDSLIKKELYERHIKDKYNVAFVLDDRNSVVEMWRNRLGLAVFQVNEGNF